MLKFKSTKIEVEGEIFTLLTFEIEGGIIEPSELKTIDITETTYKDQGLVISGRGPIWLYGALMLKFFDFAWIGTYDPRLGGAVVVGGNTPDFEIGDILKFDLPKD